METFFCTGKGLDSQALFASVRIVFPSCNTKLSRMLDHALPDCSCRHPPAVRARGILKRLLFSEDGMPLLEDSCYNVSKFERQDSLQVYDFVRTDQVILAQQCEAAQFFTPKRGRVLEKCLRFGHVPAIRIPPIGGCMMQTISIHQLNYKS